MDQDLKSKIESILNQTSKKSPDEVKTLLLQNHAFITFEKIKSFLHDKKAALKLYEDLKITLDEFYLIVYKDNAIKCGWSKNLDESETNFYCKALDESFMLSKNKIQYSLVNNNPKFSEQVNANILNIEEACQKNT